MDKVTFTRLVNRTKLTEKSISMSQRILCDGLGVAEAARESGTTPAQARDATNRVLRELRIEGRYPSDWQTITVVVPSHIAMEIHTLSKRAEIEAGLRLSQQEQQT